MKIKAIYIFLVVFGVLLHMLIEEYYLRLTERFKGAEVRIKKEKG